VVSCGLLGLADPSWRVEDDTSLIRKEILRMVSINMGRMRVVLAGVLGLSFACALLWIQQATAQATLECDLPAGEHRIIQSLPIVPPGLNHAYCMETAPSRMISAAYTYSVLAPNMLAREWVMFVPRPPNLPSQVVTNARTSPQGSIFIDLSPRHQPLFRARIQAAAPLGDREITFQLLFDAELFSRRLVQTGSGCSGGRLVEQLANEERWLSLRPTGQFDYPAKSLQMWSAARGLVRGSDEGEIDFARRVFQAITVSFHYEYLGEQNRSASYVAQIGKSDCGGLCNLFVALLRAQGVPARTLAGRWAISANPGQRVGNVTFFQEHVKAEFFAQGVGWVPVDLSSAVLYDQSPDKLLHFGNDSGNFVTIHMDSDLTFDTLLCGIKTMTLLQKASYWASGSGSFDGVTISENWTVH
jgi:transglutaminase-like putative cysteine protease